MRSMHRLLLVALKCQAMAENCKFCSIFCLCVDGECNNNRDCENIVELAFKLSDLQYAAQGSAKPVQRGCKAQM